MHVIFDQFGNFQNELTKLSLVFVALFNFIIRIFSIDTLCHLSHGSSFSFNIKSNL